jgi:hypothetical protein
VKTLRSDYKLTLNDPDPIDDFLGIHFSHQDNGELHMSQTGLIDAVAESATPATAILHADAEGLARQESWNYPSIIGQLNYLAQNSRPDISFTVHQCAHLSKEPKASHKKAVKRIIYYLQCTRDKSNKPEFKVPILFISKNNKDEDTKENAVSVKLVAARNPGMVG